MIVNMIGTVAVVSVALGAIAEVKIGVFGIGLSADMAFVTVRFLTASGIYLCAFSPVGTGFTVLVADIVHLTSEIDALF